MELPWMPMAALLPLAFMAFIALGFLLGQGAPLSIDKYGPKKSNILAKCRAITVTDSVLGTVLASLLVRDYGMFSVAVLGIAAYLCVVAISLGGMVVSLGPLLRRVLL